MPVREQEESGLSLILRSCNSSIIIVTIVYNLFDITVPTAHRKIPKLHDESLTELFTVRVNVSREDLGS